jgi:hypothetical protein
MALGAVGLMQGLRNTNVWAYHKKKLAETEVGFSRARLTRAMVVRLCRTIRNSQKAMNTIANVKIS